MHSTLARRERGRGEVEVIWTIQAGPPITYISTLAMICGSTGPDMDSGCEDEDGERSTTPSSHPTPHTNESPNNTSLIFLRCVLLLALLLLVMDAAKRANCALNLSMTVAFCCTNSSVLVSIVCFTLVRSSRKIAAVFSITSSFSSFRR